MKLSKSNINKLNGYGICSQTDINNATPLFALGCNEFSYGIVMGGEKVNGRWVLDIIHADKGARIVRNVYTMCELTDATAYTCFIHGGSVAKEMNGMRISKITHAIRWFIKTKMKDMNGLWLILAYDDDTLDCLKKSVKNTVSKFKVTMTKEEREEVENEIIQAYCLESRYL